MSEASTVAIIRLNAEKHGFISLAGFDSLVTEQHHGSSEGVSVYKLSCEKQTMFVSSIGKSHRPDQQGPTVYISGMYATKYGLSDGQKMEVTVLNGSAPSCDTVTVDPLSVDDWEILEIHASEVQSGLLSQVRVVWPGQILPVWVTPKVCIFIKVTSVSPSGSFAVLQQRSEVIVSPRSRGGNRLPNGSMPDKRTTASHPGLNRPNQEDFLTNGMATTDQSLHTAHDISSQTNEQLEGYIDNTSVEVPSSPEPSSSTDNTASTTAEVSNCAHPGGTPGLIPGASQSGQPIVNGPQQLITEFEPMALRVEGLYADCVETTCPFTNLVLRQPTTAIVSLATLCAANPRASSYNFKKGVVARVMPIPSPREKAKLEKEGEKLEGEDLTCCALIRFFVWESISECVLGLARPQQGSMVIREELCMSSGIQLTSRVRVEVLGDEGMGLELGRKSGTKLSIQPMAKLPVAMSELLLKTSVKVALDSWTSDDLPLILNRNNILPILLKEGEESLVRVKVSTGKRNRGTGRLSLLYESSSQTYEWKCRLTHFTEPVTCHLPFVTNLLPPLIREQKDVEEAIIKSIQCSILTQSTHKGLVDGMADNPTQRLRETLSKNTSSPPGKPTSSTPSSQPLPALSSTGHGPGVSSSWSNTTSQSATFPLGILMSGQTGVGKSSVLEAVQRRVYNGQPQWYSQRVSCLDYVGKRPESIGRNLERAFDEAVWRQPSVLCLDDLHLVAGSAEGPQEEMNASLGHSAQVALDIIHLFDKLKSASHAVVVIASCPSQSALNPLFFETRSHHLFEERLSLSPPEEESRLALLSVCCICGSSTAQPENAESNTVRSSPSHDRVTAAPQEPSEIGAEQGQQKLRDIAKRLDNFTPKDISLLCQRALLVCRERQSGTSNGCGLNCLTSVLSMFTPACLRQANLTETPTVTWEEVGGLKYVKDELMKLFHWPTKYKRLYSQCSSRPQTGVLLYGEPGTGKSLIVAALANKLGLSFICVKGPELLSKYIGASEQAVRDTFLRAQRCSPCLLFFDEFDSLAPRRGHDKTGVTDRVVNQLLTQLDGVEGLQGVYVIGATSRPDLIDSALLRPGRLDKLLHCPIPTEEERLHILQTLSQTLTFTPEVNLQEVSHVTDDLTGADLKAVLYDAQLIAVHEKMEARSRTASTTVTHSEAADYNGSGDSTRGVYMGNLTEDRLPLSPEMFTQLSRKVNHGGGNTATPRRVTGGDSGNVHSSGVIIQHRHLTASAANVSPSVSLLDRLKYAAIYDEFRSGKRKSGNEKLQSFRAEQRVTLA